MNRNAILRPAPRRSIAASRAKITRKAAALSWKSESRFSTATESRLLKFENSLQLAPRASLRGYDAIPAVL
jgi:hypothetical protein